MQRVTRETFVTYPLCTHTANEHDETLRQANLRLSQDGTLFPPLLTKADDATIELGNSPSIVRGYRIYKQLLQHGTAFVALLVADRGQLFILCVTRDSTGGTSEQQSRMRSE